MRRVALISLLLSLSICAAGAGKKGARADLTPRERALHLLNRFTFGPRPGDVDAVLALGIDQWLDRQLQPDSIPDAALDARLAPLRSVRMSSHDLVAAFPSQGMINQVAQGHAPMPGDRNEYSLYEVLLERMYQQRRTALAPAPAPTMEVKAVAVEPMKPDAAQAEQQEAQERANRIAAQLLELPKNQRMTALAAMPVADRMVLAKDLRGEFRDRLVGEFTPAEREIFLAMNAPAQVVVGELQQAKLLRAVYSERQLQDVMTDFWFNHFNVFIYKDADQYLTTSFERDVIRPHALGKFRDLLVAVAHSPAMLFYLDNWDSVGPHSPVALAAMRAKRTPPGLNENYGRELLELHTVGVDGGYTQQDVIEMANVFSGWTVQQPQLGGGFLFDPKRHEPGPKTIMGTTIREEGEAEGMAVLDMLARSPATAHFLSAKLAKRFVSDNPPPALIKQMTDAYLRSDGDIGEVLSAMVHSREFWSPNVVRAKVKSPFEYVASSLRATGSDVNNAGALVGVLYRMGEPLYQCQTPNGYPTTESAWMNSDALIDRLNFAIALTSGKIGGVKFDATRVLALGMLTAPATTERRTPAPTGSEAAVSMLESTLIGAPISRNTDDAIRKQVQEPQINDSLLTNPDAALGAITAAILGSPEFQHR